MTARLTPSAATASAAAALAHTLQPGAALRLPAKAPMVLAVIAGTAWVTLGEGMHPQLLGAVNDHDLRTGDLLVHAGQGLCLAPGQSLVLEPMGDAPLQFAWVLQVQTVPSSSASQTTGKGWLPRLLGLRPGRVRAGTAGRHAMPQGALLA
jgi:hypothetical protein